ncbi:DUF7219 family protein [Roseimaritima ulvae]|uniref:Uncharacterized protein n=1 Tax=Roseimaritima ulvae TaxID=980254 RepID=A0A5B9R829_9BACT|nr:hypothetical protein [Roseimaritima ulvae]QEG42911.1 hypothetical protein UC8_49530 [Roseimaritima ulvae]
MNQEDPTFAEKMLFNANLQEFAMRIGFICGLEAQEKISQAEAYDRIKQLWKELKRSKRNLNIGSDVDKG